VLLGDLFEGHGGRPLHEMLPAMRRLSAPLGVWAVNGNHEYHRPNKTASLLWDAGIELLQNRWVEIGPGLVLAGVDHFTRSRLPAPKTDIIAKILTNKPPAATILLKHAPLQYEQATRAGVELMLCGHTHGGQIWPFDYLVKLYYPLLEGRYEVDKMTAIVCRGTGTWGPRMRLLRPGEILRVTLRAKTG
ncbi:MAG: metallophosphoesterase, partial [Deltaproteobacteria bacterium]|nr:metallophosphoesterase [Deltaproteobacteria bacterium]